MGMEKLIIDFVFAVNGVFVGKNKPGAFIYRQ
jgi:hypothetical protein